MLPLNNGAAAAGQVKVTTRREMVVKEPGRSDTRWMTKALDRRRLENKSIAVRREEDHPLCFVVG